MPHVDSEQRVKSSYDLRTFADGRGNALDRSGAHATDREHALAARL